MKRGKSKMQGRKNLLKSMARDAAQTTRSRSRKMKQNYDKAMYDGSSSEEN